MSIVLPPKTSHILAADPFLSAWVTASAGTGKTHVLIDRVLRLLLSGVVPERIVCLTFTKVAAAEMFSRLQERLGSWAISDSRSLSEELGRLTDKPVSRDDLNKARQLFFEVLETPGGFKIQTIHAFCEALLRRFSAESGLPSNFDVLDERRSLELLEIVTERLFSRNDTIVWTSLTLLAPFFDKRSFIEIVASLLQNRVPLEDFFERNQTFKDTCCSEIVRVLGLEAGKGETDIIMSACQNGDIDFAGLFSAAQGLCEGNNTDRERGHLILSWLEDPVGRLEKFDLYSQAFLKKTDGTPKATLASTRLGLKYPNISTILTTEAARLEGIRNQRCACRIGTITTALMRLTRLIAISYQEEKVVRSTIDYDDLILLTRRLLSKNRDAQWVLYKLDGGIDHILVDEAQDTNPEQWDIIHSLIEDFFSGESVQGRSKTVFAVGDVKQSIYGFQGADPSLFISSGKSLATKAVPVEKRFEFVSMNLSYRSTEPILKLVDAVFSKTEMGFSVNSDASQIQHRTNRIGHAGVVELWPAETHNKGTSSRIDSIGKTQNIEDLPVNRLANRISGKIKKWLGNGELLEARGRQIKAGDILILVQKRDPIANILIRELKKENIPVSGLDRMRLLEQLAVMDLMSLGYFLLQIEDDLNLANVLKSPLFGWNEEDLYVISYKRKGSLWAELEARKDLNNQYNEVYTLLSKLLVLVDVLRPYELYSTLLSVFGGRRRMVIRLGSDAKDPIDEFLSLAIVFERDHPPTLQGFLNWLAGTDLDVKRNQIHLRNEVRVMTVHGAKGLQAPIVFLADTCNITKSRNKILWANDPSGLVPLVRTAKEDEDSVTRKIFESVCERDLNENRRLLYVALTRAEDRLYVTGFENKRGRDDGCWYNLIESALRDLDLANTTELNDEEGAILRYSSVQTANPIISDFPETKYPIKLPDWLPRAAPHRCRFSMGIRPSKVVDQKNLFPDNPRKMDVVSRRRGRLVHRLLEMLPELNREIWKTAALTLAKRSGYEFQTHEVNQIVNEAISILTDPAFKDLFFKDSLAEVAISGKIGENTVKGYIDRLILGDSQVVALDYKTDRIPPRKIGHLSSDYIRQMAVYYLLLKKIYPKKTVRCVLLWTIGPKLMEIPEEVLIDAKP